MAGKRAAADFAQHRVLAGEVAKKCGLADVEDVDDIVDAGVLVPALEEKPLRSLNNFLPEFGFLAFAQARSFWGRCRHRRCVVSFSQAVPVALAGR